MYIFSVLLVVHRLRRYMTTKKMLHADPKKDSCMRAPAKTVHDYEEDVACRSKKTVACMPGSEEREIEIRTPPETVLIVKRSSRDYALCKSG